MTVNLTRIYTRLGDGGETHLGDMSRVPKTDPRIEAYGTVDELNAQLGVALAIDGLDPQHGAWIRHIQNDLFDVGADLAAPEDAKQPDDSRAAQSSEAEAERAASASVCACSPSRRPGSSSAVTRSTPTCRR